MKMFQISKKQSPSSIDTNEIYVATAMMDLIEQQ